MRRFQRHHLLGFLQIIGGSACLIIGAGAMFAPKPDLFNNLLCLLLAVIVIRNGWGDWTKAVAQPVFEWIGSLEDDCTCRQGKLFAHVELISGVVHCDAVGDKFDSQMWFIAVYHGASDTLYHSGDSAHPLTTGEGARAIAEAIMSAHLRVYS
jgi:hypothetical protein